MLGIDLVQVADVEDQRFLDIGVVTSTLYQTPWFFSTVTFSARILSPLPRNFVSSTYYLRQ